VGVAVLHGFSPAGSDKPRILILGSFPSITSLERGEYYGHERNHFWTLLGLMLGFDPVSPYAERLSRLEHAGFALWDVIGSCEREGSLDQDIHAELPNPLAEYIGLRPTIERVALNGGKAAASFVAHAAPDLALRPELRVKGLAIGESVLWSPQSAPDRPILVARLPSSSPVPTRNYRRALDKLPSWSSLLGSGSTR
jgi:double-stranded uracil-DNA glycosylase